MTYAKKRYLIYFISTLFIMTLPFITINPDYALEKVHS